MAAQEVVEAEGLVAGINSARPHFVANALNRYCAHLTHRSKLHIRACAAFLLCAVLLMVALWWIDQTFIALVRAPLTTSFESTAPEAEIEEWSVHFPPRGIHHADTYHSMRLDVPFAVGSVVGVRALPTAPKHVHHLLLYFCGSKGTTSTVASGHVASGPHHKCGEATQLLGFDYMDYAQQIGDGARSQDASNRSLGEWRFAPGYGLTVGSATGYPYILLQAHYSAALPNGTDDASGFRLRLLRGIATAWQVGSKLYEYTAYRQMYIPQVRLCLGRWARSSWGQSSSRRCAHWRRCCSSGSCTSVTSARAWGRSAYEPSAHPRGRSPAVVMALSAPCDRPV